MKAWRHLFPRWGKVADGCRPDEGEAQRRWFSLSRPASRATLSHGRRRGRAILAAAALAVIAPIVALAVAWFRLPPLDLSPTAERSAIVMDRNGQLLRAFTMPDGRWRMPTTVEDVDPRYLEMLLAFEDRRFRSHAGVDPLALLRAAGQALRHGRIVSGGSTITMQVARLIEPRDERTLAAKLRQAARAIALERRFTKDEILSLYLSLAPFGGNIEGIRAASFAWFGKDARRLSHAEAATLVALPQSPEARRPDRHAERAVRGRNRVLAVAARAGIIPEGERLHAVGEPMPTVRRPFPMLAAHVAEAAVRERPSERVHRLTLDAGWQATLEGLARERAEQLGPKLSAAIVVVEQATGAVRASVGGAGYFADERAGAMDLTLALRSPGSALKPFIYAMAFEEGVAHPQTVLEDRPHRYGLYAPENFDQTFQGTITARKALQMSLNVPAVDLLNAVGPQRFVSRMRSAGAGLALPPEGAPGLAIGLGGVGVTLRDLTRLYAGLARGGEATPLPTGRTPWPTTRVSPGSWSRCRPGTSPMRFSVRRRRPTPWLAASPTRPAPPMATATPGPSVSTSATRSASGRAAPTTARCPASSAVSSPRRSSSTPSPASASNPASAPVRATPSSLPRRMNCRCRSATCGATCRRTRWPSPPPASSSPFRRMAPASRWLAATRRWP